MNASIVNLVLKSPTPADTSQWPIDVRAPDVEAGPRSLVVIDGRTLSRECFAQSIKSYESDAEVSAHGSIGAWLEQRQGGQRVSAVILGIGNRRASDPALMEDVKSLVGQASPAPVIVVGDGEDLAQTVKVLECGARGYIPSSMGIYVCVEAIKFVLGGGVFVPVSSVVGMFQTVVPSPEVAHPLAGLFTARQTEVVEALRRGKTNKIIAYELELRESTVKVHIRNIMKKIKASNRTEVVYKINDLCPGAFKS